jgi:hypothetical protein
MLASHSGGPGSRTGNMWGLWCTKRHWGRFSPSTSVSPANHSTDFSIIIYTRGWHNRPLSGRSVEWTLIPPPTMKIKKKSMLHTIFCIQFQSHSICITVGQFYTFYNCNMFRPLFLVIIRWYLHCHSHLPLLFPLHWPMFTIGEGLVVVYNVGF